MFANNYFAQFRLSQAVYFILIYTWESDEIAKREFDGFKYHFNSSSSLLGFGLDDFYTDF